MEESIHGRAERRDLEGTGGGDADEGADPALPGDEYEMSERRTCERALWWLTASTWLFPVALYSYAATAAAVVGHWPSYGKPDPKELELPMYHAMISVSFYVSLAAIALWLVAAPIACRVVGSRAALRYVPGFVLGAVLAVSCIYPDPVGIGDWYAD